MARDRSSKSARRPRPGTLNDALAIRLYLIVGALGLVGLPRPAPAQEALPYTTRKLSFSGLGTSVRGDIRTVGMGGAAVGLADTFIAAVDSPAGLAMTLGIGDIHFSSDSIQDAHIQNFATTLDTNSFGLALGLYPWAISVGYLSPYREDASYALKPFLQPIHASVVTREIVLSAARVFAHDRFSLGISLVLGQAARAIEFPQAKNADQSYATYTAGAALGAMIQLPKRFLLGTSVGAPLHFSGAPVEVQTRLALPGFFQPVEVPWRAAVGVGFIPNRFFRCDFTLHLLGQTASTALLRDEAALVGQRVTLQPRLGAAYVFADYKDFKATLFLGSYFEQTRILETDNRLHATGGVEARIWILTVGAAIDGADRYRNYLASIGVDVFGVLARLEMIPTVWKPPSGGMFPRPDVFSDVGLARPLVKDWKPKGPDLDPILVGIGIPQKLGLGIHNAEVELKRIRDQIAAALKASNERALRNEENVRKTDAKRVAAQKAVDEEGARQADEAKKRNKRRRRHLDPIPVQP